MYIKTQKVGDRTIVHERSYYDLTLATSDEDGAYLIALVQVDDNLTPLAPGKSACAGVLGTLTMISYHGVSWVL